VAGKPGDWQAGFALLEMLLAGFLLSISMVGLTLLFSSVRAAAIGQADYRAASFLAEQRIETLQASGFTAIAVTPTPTSESIWLCLDGTVSPGAACTGPNPGRQFNRTTCVRYVQDGNPDSPASTPPSCTGCSLGGSCTQRSKRVEVTVTPVALWATPVIVTTVATPTQVGP